MFHGSQAPIDTQNRQLETLGEVPNQLVVSSNATNLTVKQKETMP